MKIIVIGLVGLLLLTGCASIGHREAQLKVEPDGTVVHSGSSYGFMNPRDAGPQDLADAKLKSVLADRIKTNSAATASGVKAGSNYIGVVINMESAYSVLVDDPEMSTKHRLGPNGFVLLETQNIPDYIYAQYNSRKRSSKIHVYKKPGYYNGVKYDYGVRLYRTY